MYPREQFKSFTAQELYCPKCKCAMPVREQLLLILPDGDLYNYACVRCSTSLGKRTVSQTDTDKRIILV